MNDIAYQTSWPLRQSVPVAVNSSRSDPPWSMSPWWISTRIAQPGRPPGLVTAMTRDGSWSERWSYPPIQPILRSLGHVGAWQPPENAAGGCCVGGGELVGGAVAGVGWAGAGRCPAG